MLLETAHDVVETTDHWYWRAGWRVGRGVVAFHLVPDDGALDALAARLAPALGEVALAQPVPARWLHMTLTTVGFEDEVDAEALRAVADEVFDAWAGAPSPVVRFDRAFVAGESLMLTTPDLPWLASHAQAQRDAVDRALGQRPWGAFWPHLSVAYFTGATDPATVARAVAPVIRQLPQALDVPMRLTLARQHRDNRQHEWSVLREA